MVTLVVKRTGVHVTRHLCLRFDRIRFGGWVKRSIEDREVSGDSETPLDQRRRFRTQWKIINHRGIRLPVQLIAQRFDQSLWGYGRSSTREYTTALFTSWSSTDISSMHCSLYSRWMTIREYTSDSHCSRFRLTSLI